MKPVQNYKVLYEALSKQSAEKDNLIVLLQLQLTQMAGERQALQSVIADQQEELKNQLAQINEQCAELDQQHQTIAGQVEKISQQQTIIREQNTLVENQQQQLDKNKKELLRLDDLRYEMAVLKKWVYGIKSEKRHQPATSGKPDTGDQLTLQMEVDNLGVCNITDRRKVPEHLRIIKFTTPKKAGEDMIFRQAWRSKLTSWMLMTNQLVPGVWVMSINGNWPVIPCGGILK